jgi:hypothetical protein
LLREGGIEERGGFAPSLKTLPQLRGAGLREAKPQNREFKRGEAPLHKNFPFPLTRGRGYRGWG